MILNEHSFSKLFDASFAFVNNLKELVEAFNLANGNLLEVNIGWATKDFGEEVFSLLIIKEVNFVVPLVIELSSGFSSFVNPLEEESLI